MDSAISHVMKYSLSNFSSTQLSAKGVAFSLLRNDHCSGVHPSQLIIQFLSINHISTQRIYVNIKTSHPHIMYVPMECFQQWCVVM